MSTSAARAWVEIDLPAIDRNVGRIKQALPPHVRYVAVVKANAYGHGMPEVATRLRAPLYVYGDGADGAQPAAAAVGLHLPETARRLDRRSRGRDAGAGAGYRGSRGA